MTNGAKGSAGKSKARARARGHLGKMNEKTKEFFKALKKNVDSNIEVLDDLTTSLLAEDAEHTHHDCATDICAATVAWWGNAMDFFHDVAKTCLPDPEKDPA